MPNHFHFMVITKEEACNQIMIAGMESHLQEFSKAIGKTLSSYAKAINIQNGTTGCLFQKKTRAKLLKDEQVENIQAINRSDYISTCVRYIHENPLQAGLVDDAADWKHSSLAEFEGKVKTGICNREKLFSLTGFSTRDFELQAN